MININYFPLIGKTIDEARIWLSKNEITNPNYNVKVTEIVSLDGIVKLGYKGSRLNVVIENGIIIDVVGIG